MVKIGLYFGKGKGDRRGGPYVRACALVKALPNVEIFSKVSEAKKYDLLDLQWRIDPLLLSYINRVNKPFICTHHGFLPPTPKYMSNIHAMVAMFYRTRQQKSILKKAVRVIAVSEESKRQLQGIVPEERIIVVYAGLDIEKYHGGFKTDSFLFLNSLEKYENLQVILNALKENGWQDYTCESMATFPPFIVNVYGYGRLEDYYRMQINDLALPVNLNEEITNVSVKSELAKANGLIQPAINETFGLPICEAMASKTIAMASDIPSHRENFENVLFFDPYDGKKLGKLMQGVLDGKYKHLIKPALKEVKEKYNLKRFIKGTKEVYESVL